MSATPGTNPVDQRNDDLLFTITQQTGQGIDGLLNAMFGFLQRRTDFFYQMEPGDKMGFPPGIAESMVRYHSKLMSLGVFILQEVSGLALQEVPIEA
jgi:N-terminal conserved domain of Nudc.